MGFIVPGPGTGKNNGRKVFRTTGNRSAPFERTVAASLEEPSSKRKLTALIEPKQCDEWFETNQVLAWFSDRLRAVHVPVSAANGGR